MKREFMDYVKDILDAVNKIELFTKHINNFRDFASDEKTALAVVKLLENIGEATKKIPEPIRSKYPNLPWNEMAGMRDILIHEYFGIDYEVVWKTIENDLPVVKNFIQQLWYGNNDK
jgi:uncharacterized protein with HEPN domain